MTLTTILFEQELSLQFISDWLGKPSALRTVSALNLPLLVEPFHYVKSTRIYLIPEKLSDKKDKIDQ